MYEKTEQVEDEQLYPSQVIQEILGYMKCHAVVIWVCVPVWVLANKALSLLTPTCAGGYSNYTLIFVALVQVHLMWTEQKTWYLTKSLLTPPEVTVMRHLGVTAKRRRKLIQGMMEECEVIFAMLFPFIAHECHSITSFWLQSWVKVPVIGEVLVRVFSVLRYWGTAGILALIVMIAGIFGLVRMCTHVGINMKEVDNLPDSRLTGKEFFALASYANTSKLPGISMLAEAMANQRKFQYDSSKDARERTKSTSNYWLDPRMYESLELQNTEEAHAVEAKSTQYHRFDLMVNVLVCSVMLIWLQASFFAISFDHTGVEAKVKLIGNIALAASLALYRSSTSIPTLKFLGLFLFVIVACLVAWAGAKVYFAFKCEHHLWNLMNGCITPTPNT